MSNIDKQAMQAVADLKAGYTLGHADVAILNELVRIALASLEADGDSEPVAFINGAWTLVYYRPPKELGLKIGDKLFAAPPAPVSVPTFDEWLEIRGNKPLGWVKDAMRESYDACRAAMLQGSDNELQRKAAIHDALCGKYNVESLADFVDWQRNHIAELEAAPPAPVGQDETAVMPDYPGYALTQRECYQAGKKAGLAEAGNSPVIANGWVACSERMPEKNERVLIFINFNCDSVPPSIHDAQFTGSTFRRGGATVNVFPLEDGYGVTHWMPLPAAPQQEELL